MNVKLIIPHGSDSWSERKRKTYVHECICTIVEKWKDTTTMPGVGFCVDTNGDIIEEDVTIVNTFLETPPGPYGIIPSAIREWWIDLALKIQREMEQEYVYLEFSPTEVIYVNKETETKEEDWCSIDVGGEA